MVSTETLKDDISNFSSGVSGGICFRCIVDGKMGYASTEIMEPDEMRELVSRASNNAKYIENHDEAIIFKGSAQYGRKTSCPAIFPETGLMKKNALELQRNTYAQSKFVTDGTQSQIFAFETETYLSNSRGLNLHNVAGMSGGYVKAVIKENGESSEDFEFALGHDLESLLPLSKAAVDTARSKIGAGEIPSGRYDIVLNGRQMRSILSAFSPVFSGKRAYLGLSLLAGKENTAVASDCVTITDDPFDPNCPVQTFFDAEGVAVYRKSVVEKGVLKTLLYDLANAKKAGVESTANASKGNYADTVGISPYRFGIEPGEYSLEKLFEIMGNGLYITEIKGLNAGADEKTGDFSIESAGFEVKNGKIIRPVKSFTIAGNFYELLKNISHIGNKTEYGIPGGYTVFASPAVLVRNISAAGK
jgi:PmbA protein